MKQSKMPPQVREPDRLSAATALRIMAVLLVGMLLGMLLAWSVSCAVHAGDRQRQINQKEVMENDLEQVEL